MRCLYDEIINIFEVSMFDNLAGKVFGLVNVVEKDDLIMISGIDTYRLTKDFVKVWKSRKALLLMFVEIRSHKLVFPKFFAVDILYIFQTLINEKNIRSNKYRLTKIAELLESNTWLKRLSLSYDDILDYTQLKKLHHTLYPHQLTAIQTYNSKVPKMGLNGFMLAIDPGGGKTITSLAIAECLHSEVVIVVVLKTLIDTVWIDGIREEFGTDTTIWYPEAKVPLTTKYKYYVVNYEQIQTMLPIMETFKNKNVTIILDESHNLNDPTSLRSTRFISLCHSCKCQNVIFSSGTPIKAIGAECITILKCIDPLFTDVAAENFKKIYSASAIEATRILANRIDLISHKIPRHEFMKIEPPIIHRKNIKIPTGDKYTINNVKVLMLEYIKDRQIFYHSNMDKYIKIYEDVLALCRTKFTSKQDTLELEKYITYITTISDNYDPVAHKPILQFCKDFEKKKIYPLLSSDIKKEYQNAIVVIRYTKLKVLGEALGNVLLKLREECHSDMVPHSDIIDIISSADKKTLIFSSFVATLEAYESFIKHEGFSPVSIYGDTTKFTGDIVKKVQTDPDINPLLATYKSLSAGATVTACNVCVFTDLPPRDYIVEQSYSRIFRIGQDTQTHIYEFVLDTGSEPNISTRMDDILAWSRTQVDVLMGKRVDATFGTECLHVENLDLTDYFSVLDLDQAVREIETLGLDRYVENSTTYLDNTNVPRSVIHLFLKK